MTDLAPQAGAGDPEAPVPGGAGEAAFGSDVVAQVLRDIGIPYVALNPGASFRGLHDSLVNFLGNRAPKLLLCLHEEHAVAIAHGYAKVTGRAMAAAVHSNVGLMHATMAIFNAWCDRMPVLVIGATGPLDAEARRPWIDWIHTAADQGALVRPYVKWDAQPASAGAARMDVLRAAWLAQSAPMAPVYVNLDAGMQEASLEAPLPVIDVRRHMPRQASGVAPSEAADLLRRLEAARAPVLLAGRVDRSVEGWEARIALAERFGMRVVTDTKVAAAFPTRHPLHMGDLRGPEGPAAKAALAQADLVLALDWVDLAGALAVASAGAFVVRVGLDHALHNGWSMDHQRHPAADLHLACTPEDCVDALAQAAGELPVPRYVPVPRTPCETGQGGALDQADIAAALARVVGQGAVSLLHVTLSWQARLWPLDHPLDFLGSDGGGGLGAGPGHAVGAALALRDAGDPRLPVAVCGDGDFLMGVTALWTAVHYRVPLLLVVADNRSFFNDEVHQERVARMRGRPVENKWIGMRMQDPEIALTKMAEAQGCAAFGPESERDGLDEALARAVEEVRAGGVAVVQVLTGAAYPPALVEALTPGA